MRRVYGLPEIALIEMGDFVGAVLKHLRKVPVPRLSLCGGFGKISKLAAGHMDLHSRHSSIDLPQLAGWAGHWRRRSAAGRHHRRQHQPAGARPGHAAGIALGDAVCAMPGLRPQRGAGAGAGGSVRHRPPGRHRRPGGVQ
jgi:cobalt-precorrin-5B (C1)-methyltransferase